MRLTVKEKLKIYTRYIGQKVVLRDVNEMIEEQIGVLIGVNRSGIQVQVGRISRWVPLYEEFEVYQIQLLLKPLKTLTEDIKNTANSLPIQNFITQYYVELGFDMPVFISPNHPANCKYVAELGLANYESKLNQKEKFLVSA